MYLEHLIRVYLSRWESGMELGCSLLPKWNRTVRYHPRGTSVKDKDEVLVPSDPSASH